MIKSNTKKIALITGASRGIGKEISILLAKNNVHVILLARTIGALEELNDNIINNGGSATIVQMDLNNLNSIFQLSKEISERWGRLDILIANAGYLHNLTPMSHISEKDWQLSFNINLNSNWFLIKNLENLLLKSKFGRAIFLTSGASLGHRPFWGAYAVSKAALDAMIRAWSSEMKETNLKINLYDPGATRTQMRAKAYPGEDPNSLKPPRDAALDILKLCDKKNKVSGERFEYKLINNDP
tara:strand:+ start:27 stop:752 length:726 start_codon:yes stop_codon:yes gene_type:complete